MTDRTSLKLNDERKQLFDQASQIIASEPLDDPPRSDVIDAALTHLIESRENIEEVRDSTHLKQSRTVLTPQSLNFATEHILNQNGGNGSVQRKHTFEDSGG